MSDAARAPACHAVLVSAMVGVGVAEGGGGGGGPGDGYYGEYYPPEQYYVPQEMCPHPSQHPQHAHMCTVLPEYGELLYNLQVLPIPPSLGVTFFK